MKKTLSLILALCMCLISITGCGSEREDSTHTHSFESSWSYNEEYHWHSCEVNNCEEVADKKAHNWKRHTELDIKATSDEDGVMAYICEVCGKIKKETVTFNGISDTEWKVMLDASNFENYTLQDQTKAVIAMLSDGSKMEMTTTNILKFADGKVHSSFIAVTDGQESSGSRLYESQDAIFVNNSFTEMFEALKREDFEYDPEANQYIAKRSIEIPVWYTYYGTDGQETTVPDTQQWENVIIKFSSGRLAKISYNTIVVSEELGTSTEYEVVYTFSDYGATMISESGSSLQGAMSEAEWNSMLDASNFANYTLNYEQSYVNEYSDGSEEERVHSAVAVRITSDKMAERYLDLLLPDSTWSNWFVYETGESEKYSQEWIFMTLLDGKYNEWQYDADKNIYYAPNGIITTCFMEIPILVEMSSGEVKVSANGRLSEATFDVIFTDETYGMVQEGVFMFRFSDYGTTVISEDITPAPPIPDPEPDPTPVNELEYTLSEDGTYYSVTGIGSCTDTNIIIPSTYKGLPVSNIGKSAFYDCSHITSVEIPNNIESIGRNAFWGCSGITNIDIPLGVKTIGWSAFNDCSNLKYVHIPQSVTHIGDDAFNNCSSLKEVHIDDITAWCNIYFEYSPDSFSVNCSSNPMYYADNLYLNGELITKLIIPNNVSKIREVVFYGCHSITSIVFEDNSQCTEIAARAFYNCVNITSINIPEKIEQIDSYAFSNCYKLVEVYNLSNLTIAVGDNNNGGVGYYAKFIYTDENYSSKLCQLGDYIFYCNSDTNEYYLMGYEGTDVNLVLPNDINGHTYEIFKYAFYEDKDITEVTIGNKIESIGQRSFYHCLNLKKVIFEQDSQCCEIGEAAFYRCTQIETVTIPNSVTAIGSVAFGNCMNLKSVVFEGISHCEKIGSSAFSWCSSLVCIEIPDSVTYIERNAFERCSKLQKIIFGKNSRLSIIESEAFEDCSSLEEVHIGNLAAWCNISFYGIGTNNPLMCAGNLFLDGKLTTELVIPNGVTSIGAKAFYGCDYISSIVIPDTVTSIGTDAFCYCNGIRNATMPAFAVSYIPKTNLTSVTITSGDHIGDFAFEGCETLINLTIPSSINRIYPGAFNDCPNLKYNEYDNAYYLGNESNPYVALIKVCNIDITFCTIHEDTRVIYEYSFYNCKKLTSIIIPESIISIGDDAFLGCYKLLEVYNLANLVLDVGSKDHGRVAFYAEKIYTSMEVKSNIEKHGDYMFYCDDDSNKYYLLEYIGTSPEIILPDDVNGHDYVIYWYAFYCNYEILTITISTGVTLIGDSAFYGCSNLQTVYYTGTQEDWDIITIGNGNQPLLTANIQYGVEE